MARWSSRFFDKEGSEMAIQTEGRLARKMRTREQQRLLAAQSRAECTDLREPGRENAVASGAPCRRRNF